MRYHHIAALFALTLISASLIAMPAQHSDASSTPSQAIRIGVPLVNIYAAVVDKQNVNVPNLDQSDFKIFEDKVEQKIAFFSHEKTLPLSIGLLIDTSGSEENMISAEQQAASQFLHRILQEGDKAFIVAFDVDAVMLANWTNDLPTLDRAIDRVAVGVAGASKPKPGPFFQYRGGTRLYDTIYSAAVKEMKDQSRRKALIILTDATDEGSYIDLKQAVESAQRADTLVQVLVVYDRREHADFSAAKHLAEDTGGRAIDVANPKKIQSAFDEISEELRTEYSLGYYPTNSRPDGSYRQLKLQLTSRKYKVFTRKGYYARTAGN
jgi:VWFA-related protein